MRSFANRTFTSAQTARELIFPSFWRFDILEVQRETSDILSH